jgi:transcription elongation factor Elf1
MSWENAKSMSTKRYTCGYCGNNLVSNIGYYGENFGNIFICHFCNKPTFFDANKNQVPGSFYGGLIKEISNLNVQDLYSEARSCMSCNAYTAATLCCRKLLMNIAVSKGAGEGEKFIYYVEYLSDKNYVPPDAKDWVDHIRKKGNEATHEIQIIKKEDAEELMDFVQVLLKIIYEFPATIKKKYIDNQ